MVENTFGNLAETVADLVRQGTQPQIVKAADGREFLILPDSMESHEVSRDTLDEYGLKRAKPAYLKQNITLQAADSLVLYVNRFKDEDTVLFADMAGSLIEAVIDYHVASAGVATPNRCAHRAQMTLPFSEEWKIWSGVNKQLMPQLEFARFIEENAPDIKAPVAGELLDAVRDLQAHRKVSFTKAVRTSSENESFEFQDETEARTKGDIELPTKFVLSLPVYFGESPTELQAFLRWKIDGEKGGLTLGIALHRAEHVRQAVFRQIMLAVGDQTKCQVVFGKSS